MSITRREVLGRGAGAGAAFVAGSSLLSSTVPAHASAADELIASFTGGASVGTGRISLGAPQIAENGNTVPISVSVESAMNDADNVAEVIVVSKGNPAPGIASFKFTQLSGKATASTRIRLAKTQELVAIARMGDGSFIGDTKTVKVTIGGCGG